MNTIKISWNLYRDALISKIITFYPFSDFIFKDFKFVFDDQSQENKGIDEEYIVHFDSSNKTMFVENRDYCGADCKYPTDYYTAKAQWTYVSDVMHGVAIGCFEWTNEKLMKEYDEVAYKICKIVLWYMGWIMQESQKRFRRQQKSIGRKYKYSREHRLSTQNNKIWLLDDIVNYIHDSYVSEGTNHSIQCPCWEVRGHYRHYKSGKVVFIPSYRKGKQRDTAKPKDKEYYA